MEPSFEKKQTVKGVGQFLQLVGDSYYERYKKYWSKINTCSNITSILPFTETFQCLGKMARNIFVTRPRDECQSEIVQLKTLEVVLSEGGDELARNMGELLQRAGDAMNEEYLSLSTSTSESNLNRLCFVLQCVKVLVHLSEFIWQIWEDVWMVSQKQIQKAPNKATYAIRSMALLESRVSCIMFLKEWKNIMTQPCESAREKWGYLQKGSTRTSFDNNNNNNYTTTTITSKKKLIKEKKTLQTFYLTFWTIFLTKESVELHVRKNKMKKKSHVFYMCKCMIVIFENN